MPDVIYDGIYQPGTLFRDPTKKLDALIQHFRGVHKDLGKVVQDIGTLEQYYDGSQSIHIPTLLRPHELYEFSCGLLRLASTSLTLQRLICQDAAGFEGTDILLGDTNTRIHVALEDQYDKYLRAKEADGKGENPSDVRIVTSFVEALFLQPILPKLGNCQVAYSSKNEKRGILPNVYVNADWGNFKTKKPIPFSFGSDILVNGNFLPNPYRREYIPPPPPPPPPLNPLRNVHLVRRARKLPAISNGTMRHANETTGMQPPSSPSAKRLRRLRDILHDGMRWNEKRAYQKYFEGFSPTSSLMTREAITGDSLGNFSMSSTSTMVDSSLENAGMQEILESPLVSGSKKRKLAPFPLSLPPLPQFNSPIEIPDTQDESNSSSFFSPTAASLIGDQEHPIVLPETQDDSYPFEEFLYDLKNSRDN